MATNTSFLAPNNSSNAAFRAWASAIHSALVNTCGWTQTADTGQINFATVVAPVGSSSYPGYAVYAMADALQGTYPCYLRIDFGSGVTGFALPSIKVQIGTGTDGAGTLNGNTVTQRTLSCLTSDSNSWNCYFSGTTSRFTMVLWPTTSNSFNIMVNIERSVDAAGAETNTGIGFRGMQNDGSASFSQFLCNAGLGAVPASETRWLAYGSNANAASAGLNLASISGLRQAYGPLLNPELGMMCCSSTFAFGAPVTVSRYSSNRNYFMVSSFSMQAGVISYATAPKFLMLWE